MDAFSRQDSLKLLIPGPPDLSYHSLVSQEGKKQDTNNQGHGQ